MQGGFFWNVGSVWRILRMWAIPRSSSKTRTDRAFNELKIVTFCRDIPRRVNGVGM